MPRKLKTGPIPTDKWAGIYPRHATYEQQRKHRRKKAKENKAFRARCKARWEAQPLDPVTPEVAAILAAEKKFVWRDCSIPIPTPKQEEPKRGFWYWLGAVVAMCFTGHL